MSRTNSAPAFRRSKLYSAVHTSLAMMTAGATGLALPSISVAQEENENIEEIVVTAQRTNLRSAQDLKRMSDMVVDSVTAEDIGSLPDRSVTETLQRIPGVAINRFAAGRDPDHFSVEGSGVVVRGLTYVRSELNGRDSFTANNGRGLSFADVPAELMGGVDVFKTPTADRVEGGISGSVNLRTRLPFEKPGPQFALSAESNYGDFIEEAEPTYTIFGSNTFETEVGLFGVLGSFVNSTLASRADRIQLSNFGEREIWNINGNEEFVCQFIPNTDDPPVGHRAGEDPFSAPCNPALAQTVTEDMVAESDKSSIYFPRGAVAGSQTFEREREGYSAALQWRSPDESMEATFQFMRSDSREAWTERVVEIATDNVNANVSDFRHGTDVACTYEADCVADSRLIPGTNFAYDSSSVFDNGYITGGTGWRDDQWSGTPSRVPIYGLQSNNIRRDVEQRYVTDDYSFNFKWFANEDLALSFDYQHVDSTVDNLDAGLWTSTYQDAYIDIQGNDTPVVRFENPQVVCPDGGWGNTCVEYASGAHPDYSDPYNSFYRSAMDHIEESEGTSDAFRVDADYSLSNGGLFKSVQTGYRFANRDQTARFSTYNWGVLSEQWGNGGPVWLDETIPGISEAKFEAASFEDFMKGEASSPLGDQQRLFYSQNVVDNYQAYSDYALAVNEAWGDNGQNWVPMAMREGVVPGTPFLPGEINPVEETNNAFYVTTKIGHEFSNGWSLSGNLGIRYTTTDREASGYEQFTEQSFSTEQDCIDQANDPLQQPTPWCQLAPSVRDDARAFSNGALVPMEADLDYNYWLPSANVKLEVADGLQFRASYFKGVAPPDFGLTRAYFNVELGTQQADIDASTGGDRPIARFSAGNPYLMPVEADNYDLTAEWYFSDVGQLSFALFYKELDNIRTNSTVRETLTNNGESFEAIITTPVNSPETGKIKGFEISYQQSYDFLPGWMGGFGLSANYTYVDSSNVPQSTLSETDPDVAAGDQSTVDLGLLPLEGLSKHTFNIAPFYEYGRWSARLAYSWRDDFLLTIRDVIVPYQPIMQEASGQLDASVFYNINDNFQIGLQAVNLLEEVIQTSAVLNDNLQTAPRSWYINDSRYVGVLRYKF